MAATMTFKTQGELLECAERHYDLLITRGVAPEVAADRVWDCYTRAFGENDKPLADKHDKLFENQLQAIVQKGKSRMRKFNWDSITASNEGGFKPLPAGPYVVRVVDAVDKTDKEYVEIVFDIAEGEHAGFYSDDWGKNHPYSHHFFMSYKETAAGMLKGRLETFAASNPGFDPFAAWEAGRLDMFYGRIIGVNLQEEEYETSDGDIRTRLNVCQVVDVQRVRDGKVKTRELKKLGGKTAPATKPTEVYAGEIPFD